MDRVEPAWQGHQGQGREQEQGRGHALAGLSFWLLAGLFVLAFLTGGSARGDVAGLMLLRPVAILLLGIGLISLEWRQVMAYRLLFTLAAAALGLVLLHLMPLPPVIAHALPQRAILADIDRAAGLDGVWRPMTMTPEATRNALWALMPPLAVLVLGAQLSARQRAGMLNVVLALGFVSAFLAVLQILGDPHGALYLYPITNNGEAVGLFANRNHQAVLLAGMIPMLAVWVRLQPERRRPLGFRLRFREFGAVLAGLVLIPLILITGSRLGLFAGVVALASLPQFLRMEASPLVRAAPLLLLVGVAVLAILTVWMDRAVAVDRLITRNLADDMRVRIAPVLYEMIRDFLPWGSGFGSFPQVYQLYEPDSLLAPVYMNHAHNDWLELALTGGIPALFLSACAVAGWLVRAFFLVMHPDAGGDAGLGRLGLVLVLLFGLASLSDYPLRVPSLACLCVLAAVWIAAPLKVETGDWRADRDDGPPRSILPRWRPGTFLSISRRNLQCA